ncbi:cystathionine beta-lyase [Bacillus tianshenii]|nr:cystathionine beta-lyase [Bacillus tianshenii]
MSKHYTFQTSLLHNNHKVDPTTGAVSVPLIHSSTFHQTDIEQFGEYEYARGGNPTRKALEETIAQLEGGTAGFAFPSGMAAISTVFTLLSQGDHILVTEDVYGGTYRVVTQVLPRFGIEYTFVDMTKLEDVEKAIQPNTKVVYLETPSNPLLKVTDLKAVCEIAKAHNCYAFVDNTFLTPDIQRPLELGADVVVHSATKFLGGHSDIVAGLAVTNDDALAEQIGFLQNAFGSILGPNDCWLLLRGIKTLHVRMQQSVQSAEKITSFLASHPAVKNIFYPGLSSHPGNDIQYRQASNGGAVLSFELENQHAVKTFVEHCQLPVFAVSLGAVESILSYPRTMSHGSVPNDECDRCGITEGLLRLSVGLEDADDLIADFSQALSHVQDGAAV